MQKFTIAWDASLGGSFEVEANSSEEAVEKIQNRILSGGITLDDLEMLENSIYDVEEGTDND